MNGIGPGDADSVWLGCCGIWANAGGSAGCGSTGAIGEGSKNTGGTNTPAPDTENLRPSLPEKPLLIPEVCVYRYELVSSARNSAAEGLSPAKAESDSPDLFLPERLRDRVSLRDFQRVFELRIRTSDHGALIIARVAARAVRRRARDSRARGAAAHPGRDERIRHGAIAAAPPALLRHLPHLGAVLRLERAAALRLDLRARNSVCVGQEAHTDAAIRGGIR